MDPVATQAAQSGVGVILQYGLSGVINLVSIWWIYRQSNKIDALQEARLNDQKACGAQHVEMLGKQFDTGSKVADSLGALERLFDTKMVPR